MSCARLHHTGPTIGGLFAQIEAAAREDEAIARGMALRLFEMLREVRPDLAETMVNQIVRGGLAAWQARRIRQHVTANVGRPLALNAMAQLVRLSPSHFCRSFKLTFGETFGSYVAHLRIAEAQRMMRDTNEPLGQIALACGFSDQSHFTRIFTRHVGLSPNAWRRSRAEEIEEPRSPTIASAARA